MGEITSEMPATKNRHNVALPIKHGRGKIETLKEKGISPDEYQQAERIAKHPDILDRVIEQSKEVVSLYLKGH